MKWIRRWRADLIVAGIYACLTIVMTWPLVLRLNSHFAGQDIDVWINTWVTWWTGKAISEGQNLYYTRLMFYPHGVSLAFHSFSHVNTALALLLRSWLGDLGAHNVTILLAHALSGYAMFCLVRYLARSLVGAFFAGLVFAFFPYRMAESVHPVLISTQWMPLFFLFLLRLVKEGHKRDIVPAALFFVLTALSSWHLMVFTVLPSTIYLCYLVAVEHWRPSRAMVLNLVALAVLICIVLAPALYPLVWEQLSTSRSYMGVSLETGRGNDLAAFIIPAKEHPVLGALVEPVYERIRILRSTYLGVTVIGLSVVASLVDWKRARFWIMLTLLSILFSVDPDVRIGGHALGIRVPWSAPIVWLLRRPFRFGLLIGFALAVTSGLGLSAALRGVSRNRPGIRWLVAGGAMILLVFEYLYFPFPTTPASVPEFYYNLSALPGEGAVLELPMGRQRSKLYMYYQTVHNRPVVEGHISRTPEEAYAFIEATPVLRSFRACRDWILPPGDLSPLLDALGESGVEYAVLHKQLATPGSLDLWMNVRTIDPDYEDEQIAVYDTRAARLRSSGRGQAQLLEGCIAVHPLLTGSISASQGEVVEIPVEWIAGNTLERDYDLVLTLTDEADKAELRYRYRVVPGGSVMDWAATSRHVVSYSLPLDLSVSPGLYHVGAMLVPREGEWDQVLSTHLLDIEVLDRPSNVTPLAVNATFGAELSLHGGSLKVEDNAVRVNLLWQSLRQLDVDYKIFVHLYDAKSGTLVAQEDLMPHGWAYPTTWWKAEEVVSDEITLSLEGVPSGTYQLGLGVYNPYTGDRLAIVDVPPYLDAGQGRLILPGAIVR
jgi:hypothetical protein